MASSRKSDQLLAMIRDGKPMTSAQMLNLIFQLSIPSILAQVTSVLMFFIDQAMVGRISVEAAAACGLVETSTWLFSNITMAASMGFSVQVAHQIGAGDFKRAREVFRHALLVTTVLSCALGLFGLAIASRLPFWLGGGADIAKDATIYFGMFMIVLPFFQLSGLSGSMLKCSGNMRLPSTMSVIMCILDVCFNFFFIFICHLGVLGVALGTGLAIVIGGLVQTYFAVFRSPMLSLRREGESFKYESSYVKKATKIGAPMAMNSVLMSGAHIVCTAIVAPLGNIALAADTFAITAESVCYMPGVGIGDAATTLIGQSMGAGRRNLCRTFARMSVATGMVVMAVMAALMYAFAPQLMAIMSPVQSIIDLGASVLRIEAWAEPMFAAAIVCYSVFVGAGDTMRPAIMNLFSIWAVRLTLAALLASRYGLRGVWIAMAIELTFRGAIFLVRLFRDRWMKDLGAVREGASSRPIAAE